MMNARLSRTLVLLMYFGGMIVYGQPAAITSMSATPSTDLRQEAGSGYRSERPTLIPVPQQRTFDGKVMVAGSLSQAADLGLSEEEHIHFAKPDDREEKLATLKLYAEKDGFKIISLDRFPQVLDDAQCKDGSVTLKFANEESFHQAVTQWDWVNADESHKVALFTFSTHCDLGVDRKDDLQVWDVDSLTHDESARSVTFSAKPKEVQEVFKQWHFVANSKGFNLADSAKRRLRRADVTKSASIDITSDFSKIGDRNLGFCWPETAKPQDILMANASPEDAAGCMFCETCETFGSFDFELSIMASLTNGLGGTFKLTANNVGATLLARTELYKSHLRGVPFKQEIFGFVPPGAGIYAKGFIDIGPTLKASLSTAIGDNPEPLSLSTGLNITIPDGSDIVMNLGGKDKSGVSGWTPKVELLGPSLSDSASLTAKMGPDVAIFLAAKILGQGISTGFSWAAAELDLKAESIDTDQPCGKPKAKKGVDFEVDIGTSLDAFLDIKFFGKGLNETWPLTSTKEETSSTCQPIMDPTRISKPSAMPSTLLDDFKPKDDFLGQAESAISEGIASASAAVDVVTSAVVSVASQIENAVVPMATKVESAIVSVATSIPDAVENAADTVVDGIEDIGHKIGDFFDR